MKISSIKLKNFRGAINEVALEAKHHESILLYGDNGTGKSSFLDAVEWFISDKVSHLSGEEIEKYGGLKYFSSKEDEKAFVEVKFSNNIQNKKNLILKREKLSTSFDKDNNPFQSLLTQLQSERLWIRNNQLVDFIIKSKSERLLDISNIIGYDEVAKVHKTLKKAFSDLKKVIRNQSLDSKLADKKKIIVEKLKQTINNKEQFYKAIEDLLLQSKIDLGINIKCEETYNQAMHKLKSGINEKEIAIRQTLEKIRINIPELLKNTDLIVSDIDKFLKEVKEIKKDSEKLKNISLLNLYKEAEKILSHHKKDSCPLCLSEIKREDLIKIISKKLEELSSLRERISEINQSKTAILGRLRTLFEHMNNIKNNIESDLEIKTEEINKQSEKLTLLMQKLENQNINDLNLDKVKLDKDDIYKYFKELLNTIEFKVRNKPKSSNNKITIITDISIAKQSFDEFLKIEEEKKLLDKQRETLEKIASDFNLKKRQEMSKFFSKISEYLNEYYLFMNKDQRVDKIEIKPVDKNDEFVGIILELSFHGSKITSPKQFLSESRLNCLGLSLFLSSVKIFNKEANFFILDDVISSFDKNHRYRFAQLLQEKFFDYQIITLTHEKDWFDMISSEFKSKGWHINSTIWTEQEGILLETPLITSREKIDKKIKDSNIEGLGNLLRRYTESLLKELCENLNVKLLFKFNNKNENRSLNELYENFKQRLDKKLNQSELEIVNRLKLAQHLENKLSHDSHLQENLSDLKAIYEDLKSFEDIFRCTEKTCKKLVSLKNNTSNDYITCKCGSKKLNWKFSK